MTSTIEPVTVGVDLGGTGTRLAALDRHGVVCGQRLLETPRSMSAPDLLIRTLADHISAVAGTRPLRGIGIGASGPVDANGIIRNDATLPAYSNLPLTTLITATLGVPCQIDNDATTAAIGENTYGAGHQSPSLLMITLGTGVGVGVLTPQGPFRAADGSHPEAGHLPLPGPEAPCYCGLTTCWEQLASRTALDKLTECHTTTLAESATAGDATARDLFHRYGERVGIGMAALLTIFRPERVVIGGSAAQYLPHFAPALDKAIARKSPFAWSPPYQAATLGALSGAIGAAVIARPPDTAQNRTAASHHAARH
ncbi:MAG: glucokinase [Actinoplanes sp.]|nr:glucokinase [Actinoplanes sp.]